jgi:microcystin-dependent protein
MWLTPEAAGDIVYRLLPIPAGFLSQVNGALITLEYETSWEQYGTLTPEECAAFMSSMLDAYWSGNPLIGSIHAYATASLPDGVLPCDGTVYNRVDYPALYALLDTAYIDSADTFHAPNLVGHVVMGTDTEQGTVVGSATHTLVSDEMPNHGHADTGHAHAEGIAVANLTTIGLEVPEPTALPAPGLTAVGYASISATGGGQAHNNIQPSHKMRYGIIAR